MNDDDAFGLATLLGAAVRSVDGRRLGQLVDVTVELGEPHPSIRRLMLGGRRRPVRFAEWADVVAFEPGAVRLAGVHPASAALAASELRLARDVLDMQVVDVGGKRLARVSEVLLARTVDAVRVVGVDVGAAGIWRRLGLAPLARRTGPRVVDWPDLHPASARGHALTLATPGAAVHRLTPSELATLVAHLPVTRGAEVLHAVSPDTAAGALSLSHPRIGAGLLRSLPDRSAAAAVERMPVDDATTLLRGLSAGRLAEVLAGVPSNRAAALRKLLARPADTAGGLMDTEVPTVGEDEPIEAVRARFAAAAAGVGASAAVVVVDGGHRPVGVIEPAALLAGRRAVRPVPVLPADLPVARVIDLFAVSDAVALPVVDADGRLLGAVAVSDALVELVAGRRPGRARFARIRHRAHRARPAAGREAPR